MTQLSRRTLIAALPCLGLSLLLAVPAAFAADNRFESKERSLLLAAKPPKAQRSKNDTLPKAPQPPEPGDTTTQAPATSDAEQVEKMYLLKYRFDRGDVLRYDVSHKASIRSTIDETTQSAQTRTESVKAVKVLDVLPEGDFEFNTVVEKVHMVNQLPEHDATEYDSAQDKVVPPGFEDAAKAVGVPLSVMQITPQGKVVRRESKIRNQQTEEDAPIVLRLPEKYVAIGDTWDEPFEVQVKIKDGGTKMISTRRHHKLSDVKNGVATIDVTYQVLSPIDAQIETQIVQKLMEGQVRFDIAKGHVISQELQVDKRVIGFAGPTSTMQYIMKMEETLLPEEAKTTAATPTLVPPIVGAASKATPLAESKPKKSESSAATTAKKSESSATTTAKKSTPSGSNKAQTANRQRVTSPANNSYRR
jgi:hypothetical protein